MPILAHYEVERNGTKHTVLLTEADAAKLGAVLVEPRSEVKMRRPRNKVRTAANKAT